MMNHRCVSAWESRLHPEGRRQPAPPLLWSRGKDNSKTTVNSVETVTPVDFRFFPEPEYPALLKSLVGC